MFDNITIKTTNDGIFTVSHLLIQKSTILTNLIENTIVAGENSVIELNSVDKETMEVVLYYLTQHLNDQVTDVESTDPINPEDDSFIGNDVSSIFKVIEAANFLEIKPLLELGCKKIAYLLKGKSKDEMITILGIKNDFNSKEEKEEE